MGVWECSRNIGEASSARRAGNNALGITRFVKDGRIKVKRKSRKIN